MHIENECETHKACCRGEVKPAVFHVGAGAIANHVLYVVIETVGTCNHGEMRETQRRLTSISNNHLCLNSRNVKRNTLIILLIDRKDFLATIRSALIQ